MYDYLKGKVARKAPSELVLDVQGIGFLITVTSRTLEQLPDVGSEGQVFVHMHQVENEAPRLYGFSASLDRQVFRLVIGVSKIGPAAAMSLLTSFDASDIVFFIAEEHVDQLTQAKGIGKKTAERMVLELKENFAKLAHATLPKRSAALVPQLEADLLKLLVGMGFTARDAQEKARKTVQANPDADLETLIRAAFEN